MNPDLLIPEQYTRAPDLKPVVDLWCDSWESPRGGLVLDAAGALDQVNGSGGKEGKQRSTCSLLFLNLFTHSLVHPTNIY